MPTYSGTKIVQKIDLAKKKRINYLFFFFFFYLNRWKNTICKDKNCKLQPYLSVQSKLFQEKSKPLQESKSTFIWWKVKEKRVNIKLLLYQSKPNSGKDTMLCFQISVFSLIFEGCVMRNFSLFIYINIFIYINNNIFSKMDASKTKLKSEIWKQKHILLSAFRFQFCF